MDNIKSVKKNKEKYGKIKNFFFRRRVCILVGCKHIFSKNLKLPIYPYSCQPDRTILSRLKKIKKNMEKSNFFFFSLPGLDISRMWEHFLEGLEITYLSIFLSARSDNIKPVKKNKEKCGKIENIFLRRWVYMSVKTSHVFLKDLKLPVYPYFCRPDRTIWNRLKK